MKDENIVTVKETLKKGETVFDVMRRIEQDVGEKAWSKTWFTYPLFSAPIITYQYIPMGVSE